MDGAFDWTVAFHDIWEAAKVPSPFIAMLALIFMGIRSRDAMRERGERIRCQLDTAKLQEVNKKSLEGYMREMLDTMNASAVAMSAASSGVNAMLIASNALKEIVIASSAKRDAELATMRELLTDGEKSRGPA